VFSDRRDAEKQYRAWREDPFSVGNVDMDKVWTLWIKNDIAKAINGDWHSIENIKSDPVFKYANEEWEERERIRQFKMKAAEICLEHSLTKTGREQITLMTRAHDILASIGEDNE
jgi:hypothetical protein